MRQYSRPFVSLTWLSLAALVGCGAEVAADAGDGSADSGVDANTGDGEVMTPADIPWLGAGVPPIMLLPCPEGWRDVTGAVTECDPYPEGGAEVCDDGAAHFLGESGCRSIGDACPPGDYARSLPASGSVLYVNADASGPGDGSLGAPFRALSEVPWATLSAGTTVALAKGTYPGVLRLGAGVRAVGACARDTVVTGGAPSEASAVATVTGAGEAAVVENMTLRGALHYGVVVERGRHIRLRGVLIDRVRRIGVYVSGAGAQASLSDVVVQDTEVDEAHLSASRLGIYVDLGGQVDATRLLVDGNRQFGVYATGAAGVTLTDAAVRDIDPGAEDISNSAGLFMGEGARLEAARVLIAGHYQAGVAARGAGSSLALTDVIVGDMSSRALESSDGVVGRGIDLGGGASLSALRLLVTNNRDAAAIFAGEGTEATLEDVVVRGSASLALGRSLGGGLRVQSGAHFDATRLLVSQTKDVAVLLTGPGSSMTVHDGVFEQTNPDLVTGGSGRGLVVQEGASIEASRLLIAENRSVGILASDRETYVGLVDVVVRDTRSRVSDSFFGRGVHAQYGARIEGARLQIERSIGVGLTAMVGATVVFTDVMVSGVVVSDCATTTCPSVPLGYGAAAVNGSLSLTRFQVVDATTCGVLVSSELGGDPGALDLQAGVVAGAEIGACVQVEGYELERLTHEVAYRDNATNLDSTTLPVPGVLGSLEP